MELKVKINKLYYCPLRTLFWGGGGNYEVLLEYSHMMMTIKSELK